jgi:hypothetical protein
MAAAVRTLADFVAACDDFDEVQELLDLSAGEMQAVLEEYPALLKDAAKTAGRKQREKLMSEHKGMQGGAPAGQYHEPDPAQPAGSPLPQAASMLDDVTLAQVARHADVPIDDLLHYSLEDFTELLKDELAIKVIVRNKVLAEWRALRAQATVLTVQAKFAVFLERVGGKDALQGLENVPVSGLAEATSFIVGPNTPGAAAMRTGVANALAKADSLLAEGPDRYCLTRDEIAAIHLYTQDGWVGPERNLFRPLNAALRAGERGDVKIWWGYIRLLQHALFKLPKDESGSLFRGIKVCRSDNSRLG